MHYLSNLHSTGIFVCVCVCVCTEEDGSGSTLPVLRYQTTPQPIIPLTDSYELHQEFVEPAARIGESSLHVAVVFFILSEGHYNLFSHRHFGTYNI